MMNVYRHCLNTPEIVQYFKPSVLYKICESNFPAELRQEFLNNARGVYDISKKELMVIVEQYLNGEINIDGPEIQNLLHRQKIQKVNQRYVDELKGLKRDSENRLNTISTLNKSGNYNPLLTENDNSLQKEFDELESFFEDIISDIGAKISALKEIA